MINKVLYNKEYQKKLREIKASNITFKSYHNADTKGVNHKTATQYIAKMDNIHRKLQNISLTPETKHSLYMILTNTSPTISDYRRIRKELKYINLFFVNLMKLMYTNANSLKSNLIPYMTLTSYIDKSYYKKVNYLINLETQTINKNYINDKNDNTIKEGDINKYITDFSPETLHANMQKLTDNLDKVIYGIYTFQKARRLEYGNMYITDDTYDKNIKTNYVIINDANEPSFFYFNDYKTQKTYGGQLIPINDNLKEYIKNYIISYNLKVGDKFIKYNENYMSSVIKNIFKKVYNADITLNYIRRSHATYINNLPISNNERNRLILEMGHSPSESLLYRKLI